ncbi:MAG TPA: glycosyltransferase [Terracidiphilus sp.]|nr:glycosyltransferase [Terracidiphilus sp.]
MRILFLGPINEGQTSLMRMRALKRMGHAVRGVHTIAPWLRVSWLQRQVQRRLGRGSVVNEINDEVLRAARDFHPDLVWAEKQEYLRRETLEDMRAVGARLVHFTPDPYFSVGWKRTPLMDEALLTFDVLVYCKAYERAQYETLGRQLIYMPLGYCDEVHRPLASDDRRWKCSVGFIGGWEPRRENMLRTIAAQGIDLKIWGLCWNYFCDGRWTPRRYLVMRQLAGKEDFHIRRDPLLARAHQGGEVYGDDYARALTASRIGIGFLRTVWPDQHTTRTFEIPACGSMLLADRSDEHREFFDEGKEAEYFSSAEELTDKAEFYSRNDAARERIASAGLRRCETARYAYIYLLNGVLAKITIKQSKGKSVPGFDNA